MKTHAQVEPHVQAFLSSKYRAHSAPGISLWLMRQTIFAMVDVGQTIKDVDNNLQGQKLQCQ